MGGGQVVTVYCKLRPVRSAAPRPKTKASAVACMLLQQVTYSTVACAAGYNPTDCLVRSCQQSGEQDGLGSLARLRVLSSATGDLWLRWSVFRSFVVPVQVRNCGDGALLLRWHQTRQATLLSTSAAVGPTSASTTAWQLRSSH